MVMEAQDGKLVFVSSTSPFPFTPAMQAQIIFAFTPLKILFRE